MPRQPSSCPCRTVEKNWAAEHREERSSPLSSLLSVSEEARSPLSVRTGWHTGKLIDRQAGRLTDIPEYGEGGRSGGRKRQVVYCWGQQVVFFLFSNYIPEYWGECAQSGGRKTSACSFRARVWLSISLTVEADSISLQSACADVRTGILWSFQRNLQ